MSMRAGGRGLVILAIAAVVLFAPASLAGSGNGIANSTHDFSGEEFEFRGEVCRICHVPHDHGRDTGLIGLLWNHELSAATYTMYSSETLDGAVEAEPTGISKMCLSCHDGTVSLDAYDSKTGAGNPAYLMGAYYGDNPVIPNLPGSPGDLSATHPISIVYDEANDSGLFPKTNAMGASGSIDEVLEDGKVQCHSCHDVHDSPGESVPGSELLRVAQTTSQGGDASGLCLTCHNK